MVTKLIFEPYWIKIVQTYVVERTMCGRVVVGVKTAVDV